jgi:hypothetical protein
MVITSWQRRKSMNESENEVHQHSTNLDQETFTRRRVLVGICFVAVPMACAYVVSF